MSFKPASKALGRDYALTSLVLNGGNDCYPNTCKIPDLLVMGGAHIKKNLCVDKDLIIVGDAAICGDLHVKGNLLANTQADLIITDKIVCLANVEIPTDTTANGGGIMIFGPQPGCSKSFLWYKDVGPNGSWYANYDINLGQGRVTSSMCGSDILKAGIDYRINGDSVLNATTLGANVLCSSLQKVGTLRVGSIFNGIAITNITAPSATPTVTTSEPHNLVTGDHVWITSTNSTPVIDGCYTVTVLTPTTFTVPVPTTFSGSSGYVQSDAFPIDIGVSTIDSGTHTIRCGGNLSVLDSNGFDRFFVKGETGKTTIDNIVEKDCALEVISDYSGNFSDTQSAACIDNTTDNTDIDGISSALKIEQRYDGTNTTFSNNEMTVRVAGETINVSVNPQIPTPKISVRGIDVTTTSTNNLGTNIGLFGEAGGAVGMMQATGVVGIANNNSATGGMRVGVVGCVNHDRDSIASEFANIVMGGGLVAGGYFCEPTGTAGAYSIVTSGKARMDSILLTGNIDGGNVNTGLVCAINGVRTNTISPKTGSTITMNAGSTVFNGDILPSANIMYDLGSPTQKFKDLYIANVHVCGQLFGNVVSNIPSILNVEIVNANTLVYSPLVCGNILQVDVIQGKTDATIELEANLIPIPDSTLTLGNSTHQFKTIHVQDIYVGGNVFGTIDVSTDNFISNTLITGVVCANIAKFDLANIQLANIDVAHISVLCGHSPITVGDSMIPKHVYGNYDLDLGSFEHKWDHIYGNDIIVCHNLIGNMAAATFDTISSNLATIDVVIGNTTGTHFGPTIGDVTGNVIGHVIGDLTGNTYGKHTGNICGDVLGNTYGTHYGSTIGDVTGNTTGTHTGSVFGNVYGNINAIYANVTGKLTVNDLCVNGNLSINDSKLTITDLCVTGNLIVTKNTLVGNLTASGNIDAVSFNGNSYGMHFGPTIGDVTGNVVGDVTGDLTGNSYGKHTGPVCGDVLGNVIGNTTGTHVGPTIGDVTGNVVGDVTGDLTGNSYGKHTGPVCGDVLGNLIGNTAGTHIGPTIGDIIGNVTGDVTGDLTGNSYGKHFGPVCGDVIGNVIGNVTGDVIGDVTGDVTGNTTGTHFGVTIGDVQGNLTGTVVNVTTIYAQNICANGTIQVNTIVPKTGNTITIGPNVAITNLDVTGVLTANIAMFTLPDPLIIDKLIANTVCALGNVETDSIKAKTGNTINILSNITAGYVLGNFIGELTGNTMGTHIGPTIGDVTGNTYGKHFGPVCGDVQGNLTGSYANVTTVYTQNVCATGEIQVNTIVPKSGNTITIGPNVIIANLEVTGILLANVSGFVVPDPLQVNTVIANTICALGNVATNSIKAKSGNVITVLDNLIISGSVTGTFIGDLTGNTYGKHTGNVCGDVMGNLTGTHFGPTFGNVTGNLNAFTVNVSGLLTTMDLHVIGNLDVDGDVIINDSKLILNDLCLTGNLIVDGDTTVANVTSTGNIDAINFNGNTYGTHYGISIGNVIGDVTGDVTGNTYGKHTGPVCGDVTGDVTGNTYGTHIGPVIGDVIGNVTGAIVTANLVCATGNVATDNIKPKTPGADIIMHGNVNIDGTLNVNGVATFNSNVNALASINVTDQVTTKDIVATGNSVVDGTLTVNGQTTLNDNVDINANVDISDTLTVKDICVTGNIYVDEIKSKTTGNIVFQGNLIPETDKLYEIGTTDKKWNNIVAQDMTVCGNLNVVGFTIDNCLTYQNDMVTTTNNTLTLIQSIPTTTNTVYLLEFKVIALRNDATEGAGYVYKRSFRNNGGTVSQIGGAINQQWEDAGPWDVSITISGTNIHASVQGQTGKTINWSVCTAIHSMSL